MKTTTKTDDFVDKVLKGLDICAKVGNACISCPYHGAACMVDLMLDSAKLIRAQHKKLSAVTEYNKVKSAKMALAAPEKTNALTKLFKGG